MAYRPKVLFANQKALLANPKVLLANPKALLAVELNLVGGTYTERCKTRLYYGGRFVSLLCNQK